MKIEIEVTRNGSPLTGGYLEDELLAYLGRYVRARGVFDPEFPGYFPEYDFGPVRFITGREEAGGSTDTTVA